MEPPTSNQPKDFVLPNPAIPIQPLTNLSKREQFEAYAQFIFDFVRDYIPVIWEAACLFCRAWVHPPFWGILEVLCLLLAVILQIIVMPALALATWLESASESIRRHRASGKKPSLIRTRPEDTPLVASSRGGQWFGQHTHQGEAHGDSDTEESSLAEDDDALQIHRNQGTNSGWDAIDKELDAAAAYLAKRQRGLERIKTLRERRRHNGLKV